MTSTHPAPRHAMARPPLERLAARAVLAAGLLASVTAGATTIVDSAVAAPTLAGANGVDAVDWMAESFTLTAGATIASVAVQVLDNDAASDIGQSFLLALYANVGGLPGLDFNAVNQGQLYAASATYAADGWNGVSGLQWQLAPGTYWLAVEAGSDASAVTSLFLPTGAQPAPGGVAFYSGSTSYAATGASDAFGLRIDTVAAVPEPASTALMLAGLGALGLGRRLARGRARSA